MPTEISFQVTRDRIVSALPATDPHDVRPATDLTCRSLPAWVGEFGVVGTGDEWMIYLAPVPGSPRDVMEQAVIDAPPGRYVVDVYDIAAHTWRSRESAAAPPLVIGVVAGTDAVLLLLTRVVVANS